MSYSVDFRKRTIEYRKEGHTLKETKEVFDVSISTIRLWEKQLREEGHLEPKSPEHPPKKINPDELKAYIKEHPDAYLSEIGEKFNCSGEAVRKALKRLKITRKKRVHVIKNKIRKK